MRNVKAIIGLGILLLCMDCSETTESDISTSEDAAFSKSSSGGAPVETQNPSTNAGLITAGEWNDLNNWGFWKDLFQNKEFSEKPDYWSFFLDRRISVHVMQKDSIPSPGVTIELSKGDTILWSSKTDNFGKAELWIDVFHKSANLDLQDYKLLVDGTATDKAIKLFSEGPNEIIIQTTPNFENKAEIAFVVDATGSMSDELEFLKKDLGDVISKVAKSHANVSMLTSSVFYRDQGDDYVTRLSGFTNKINTTLDFIKEQRADGGGDFPEAVHTAIGLAVNQLNWSISSKTKLLFLLLDAPPHYEKQVIGSLQNTVKMASQKGIKIIPIVASGIDKETEFLMRFLAISTNGTYVFITNDSGIGNDHLTPSVGQYEVEKLNELLVRLINKYI